LHHETLLENLPATHEARFGDSKIDLRRDLRSHHSFQLDEARMKSVVRDLHQTNRRIYWADLSATVSVGWTAFVFAVALRPFSTGMLAATAIAMFAFYRALCFVHEISHQSRRTLPGFETAWNLLVGYPLLMPSFVYVGVHQSHHKISTYGTAQDPEYLPFASSSAMSTVFALEGFFIPLVLLLRFLVLTPFGLLSRTVQKRLVVYASSLTMNVRYRREASQELIRKVRRHSAVIWVVWVGLIALAAAGLIPWRVFALWLAVCGVLSFVNALRTLGAHAYESSGEPFDRTGQLLDSIDTPGALWTELWAPVGLRYHALHHYFPGIPYHHLPEAYRRLSGTLPCSSNTYRKMSSPSLRNSLVTLYRKGLRALH
jgi:fatty acid desaturase